MWTIPHTLYSQHQNHSSTWDNSREKTHAHYIASDEVLKFYKFDSFDSLKFSFFSFVKPFYLLSDLFLMVNWTSVAGMVYLNYFYFH